MIRVEGLTFSYPSSYDTIFDGLSFQIDTDWKLGLVGRNGRGKTTLLQLLLGRYAYSGSIRHAVQFDYFPYPVKNAAQPALQAMREVCPGAAQWEYERELAGLGLQPDVLQRPFYTLSGGEQTKLLLAALFLNEGHFLLIDEPTNHLDAAARAQLAAYLQKKKGFILVSHDRCFLDGCTDHILAFNRAGIELQSGNFSSWLANFERRQQHEREQNEQLKKDIRRLQGAARRTEEWAGRVEASKKGAADKGFVGHKAAKMMKRAKVLEARQQKAAAQKQALLRDTETAAALKLQPLAHYAATLATFTGVAPLYDGRAVCKPVSFAVRRGERVVLAGANGSGKSSLLRLLLARPPRHTGTLAVAPGLIVSYVPQSAGCLQGTLAAYARENGIDESLFKAILRKMDFARVQFEKDMAEFSAGQKKKVLIAKSLCERAHLYIWDEPLNYIDIYSRMQIEQLILQFAPTMLLVEHDAAFCQAAATSVVQLQKDK